MKFSTRTTYGLRAMIKLANESEGETISLARIAKEEDLSLGYLERIFARLKKSGLVKSEKGVSGGYRLSKDSSEINVFDIVEALEGELSPFHCLDKDGKIYCSKQCNCGATSVLVKVQQAVSTTLRGIKLNDLVK